MMHEVQRLQNQKRNNEMTRAITEQEEMLKGLKTTLKEKEQLNRISTFKLNELKRNARMMGRPYNTEGQMHQSKQSKQSEK